MCWPEWLVAFLKTPLAAAIFTVGVGIPLAAWLAHLYQNRSKRMEFKFDVFREAVQVSHRLVEAVRLIDKAIMQLIGEAQDADRSLPKPDSLLSEKDWEDARSQAKVVYSQAQVLLPILLSVYSKAAVQPYTRMMDRAAAAVRTGSTDCSEHVTAAHGARIEFIKLASAEIPLRVYATARAAPAPKKE